MHDDKERKVVELSIDDILPNRFQPRIKFDDSAIYELSESIKAHGVFQPIIVRPIGDKFEIIAGERRYKASVLANKQTIPAIVMNLDDNDTVEIALIENVQRANLTPIEEAISYKKILDMGYMNQEQLANKLGKTQSTIANKLRLLNLDEDVQDALLENKISERHARSLLRLKNYGQQRIILKRIINERLTVRKTDEEIEKMFNSNQNNNQTNSDPVMINEQSVQDLGGIPEVVEEDKNQPDNQIFGFDNSSNTSSTATTPLFSDVNNEVINPSSITNVNKTTSFNSSTVMNSDLQNEGDVSIPEPTIMDIDKIATSAKDVFVEKPLAPMDKIMEKDDSIEVSEPTQDEPVIEGKFFTFTNNSEQNNTHNYAQDKNFNFDNLYQNVTPVARQEQTYDTPDLKFGVAESNIETNETKSTNNFVDLLNTSNTPLNNNVEQNNNLNKDAKSNGNSRISTPFGFSTIPSTSSNEPLINNVEPTIEPTPVASENTNLGPIPQYQDLSTVKPEINVTKNVMDAVNLVRKSIDQLKEMGFSVDTDEIDLENMYQLIVKIDK